MPTLYIIRGLPGSGKSTLAKKIVHESRHCEADMFFMVDMEYLYDPKRAKDAHAWCKAKVEALMAISSADVCVSNTFTRKWEYQPYIDMAKEMGYTIQVIELHGGWRSVHNVPAEAIQNMIERWEAFAA